MWLYLIAFAKNIQGMIDKSPKGAMHLINEHKSIILCMKRHRISPFCHSIANDAQLATGIAIIVILHIAYLL